MKTVQDIIEEYNKLAKDVDEAVNNPEISFKDGVETLKMYLEFLRIDIKEIDKYLN